MDSSEVYTAVHTFFSDKGKKIPSNSYDLFDNEWIDSMELLELILHLESKFGFEIDQELMTVDNFRSVDQIATTLADEQ